jgi:hypothetical protein
VDIVHDNTPNTQRFKCTIPYFDALLKLPLCVHVDEAQAAKLHTDANVKKRKRDRELAEIESELEKRFW